MCAPRRGAASVRGCSGPTPGDGRPRRRRCRAGLDHPGAEFEAAQEATRQIAAAERDAASSGPFRNHRIPGWLPPRVLLSRSPRRLSEAVVWDRAALDPLSGVRWASSTAPPGDPGARRLGVFFQSRAGARPRDDGRVLGIPPAGRFAITAAWLRPLGRTLFLLPGLARVGREVRGMASFLAETELIYPDSAVLSGQMRRARRPWGAPRLAAPPQSGRLSRGPGSSTTRGSAPPRPTWPCAGSDGSACLS